MINLETILSLYDDKPTLMKWLKKVEKALADSVLVGFSYNEVSPRHIKLVLTFEDGSSLETPVIELPQDYSVSNIALTNGELVFTMTNGNVINVGSIGAVSGFSINASQHLIVTYQDGTSQDLGAIFTGDISITGNFSATGTINGMEKIIDANEHRRFVEGGFAALPGGNVTTNYARWSLSGTHLMIVLAGTIPSGETISGIFAGLNIPSWIGDKIFPVFATSRIEIKNVDAYNDNDWTKQSFGLIFTKANNTYLQFSVTEPVTFTKDRNFRVQFDLLIDNQ